MNATERMELRKQGFQVLRPMYDARKEMWKIMKYTSVGGWSRFGDSWFYESEDADIAIDRIVANYPNMYVSDNFKPVSNE